MVLKEKQCSTLKGCMCANGRKQCRTKQKEETASPMVVPESIIITSVIGAMENRDGTTTDIPGAYLHAEKDDFVVMVLESKLAKLLVKAAPNIYQKYLGVGKDNKPILYVQLQKALYSCIKSALLFYKNCYRTYKSMVLLSTHTTLVW
eukprot:15105217-Ditylum_brightwellii.AAC.1